MSNKPTLSRLRSNLARFIALLGGMGHGGGHRGRGGMGGNETQISPSPSQNPLVTEQMPVLRKNPDSYHLSGKLSFETVPLLWQQSQNILQGKKHTVTIVNLSEVTHSDSTGVALLIAWTKQFRKRSENVHFVHLPQQMLAIIRLTGLETILPITV